MRLYTVILIMQVHAMLFTALNSHDGAYYKTIFMYTESVRLTSIGHSTNLAAPYLE